MRRVRFSMPGSFPDPHLEEVEEIHELPGSIPPTCEHTHAILTEPFDSHSPSLPPLLPRDDPVEIDGTEFGSHERERRRYAASPITPPQTTDPGPGYYGPSPRSGFDLGLESGSPSIIERERQPYPSSLISNISASNSRRRHSIAGLSGRNRSRSNNASNNALNEMVLCSKDELLVAVFGMTGTGKSTFISKLTGENVRIGHDLHSMTSAIQEVPFTLANRPVTIVDTPGFDDTEVSNTETLTIIASWLKASYTENTKLTGIIYLHRISDNRVSGSSYTNLSLFRSLCGMHNLSNVILATTMWDKVTPEEGARREGDLLGTDKFWGDMVRAGAQVRRHDNTASGARALMNELLSKKSITLKIQREMVKEKKTLMETAAGQAVNDQLIKMAAQHRKDMDLVKKDFEKAIKEKDQKWIKELEEHHKRLQKKISENEKNIARLKKPLVTTKSWLSGTFKCKGCGRRMRKGKKEEVTSAPCPGCKTVQLWVDK